MRYRIRPYSYSTCVAPSLNESNLVGDLGIGNASCPNAPPWRHAMIYGGSVPAFGGYCDGHSYTLVPTKRAIDFGARQADIACDPETEGMPLKTLTGFDDWNHLIYIVKPYPSGGFPSPTSRHHDITSAEVK
jgi:hypothetical protein